VGTIMKKIPKNMKNNPKVRRTINGTPVIIKTKIGKGIYLVNDFIGHTTLVAEKDLT